MSAANLIPTQHLNALRSFLAAEDSAYAAEVRYHTERFLVSPRGENEPSPALRPPSIERFARVVKVEREQFEKLREHDEPAVNHVDCITNNDANAAHLYVTSVELVSLHNRISKLKQLPPSTRHNLQRCLMRLTYWCDWTFWNTLDQWFVEQGMQRVTELESLILLDLHASPPSLPVDTAFVAHRRAKNKDRLGALCPDDLPSGWESLDFPTRWDVIGLRKWIEYSRTKLLDQPTLPESNELALLAGEVYLTRVADSHRAARRLADQRGWSGPPTPSDSQLVFSDDPTSIFHSLDYLKALEEWTDAGVAGANQQRPGKLETLGASIDSEGGAQSPLAGRAETPDELNSQPATDESNISLTVASWNDLAIGIDEDGTFLAITPVRDSGSVFPKESSVALPLRGARWKELLQLLAGSKDGNEAQKRDIFIKFGYRSKAIKKEEINDIVDDEGRMNEIKDINQKLTQAVGDLSRELREHVSAGDDQRRKNPPLSASDSKVVRSQFTCRHLLRDENGKLRFGASK